MPPVRATMMRMRAATPGQRVIRQLPVLVAVLLLPACPFVGDPSDAMRVMVGATDLTIPLPDGFRAVGVDTPAAQSAATNLVPRSNHLLAMLVPASEVERVNRGRQPTFRRYMLLQTYRDLDGYVLSPGEFAGIADRFVSQHRRMIDRLGRQAGASGGDGGTITLSLDEAQHIPLGMHTDRLNAAGYAAMTRYRYRRNDDVQAGYMAAGMNILRVRGKLLYAHVYSRVDSDADADWVHQISDDWIGAILEGNARRGGLERFGHGLTAWPLPAIAALAALLAVLVLAYRAIRRSRPR